MSDLLDLLRALDATDSEIAALKRAREEIPRALAALAAQAAAAEGRLEAEKQALEDAEKERRARERELQECESKKQKYQQQTALVKTNSEYSALLREIEAVDEQLGKLEESILLAMEESDLRTESVARVGEEARAEIAQLREQEQEKRERLAEVERQIESRSAARAELVPKLDPSIRSGYERVHAKFGTATAKIRGRTCAACFRDVPYETVNRVSVGEIHTCGTCARLLVEVIE